MPRDALQPIAHQRAHGRAEIVLAASASEGARLRHLYHAAPLRWLFPTVDPGDPKLGALVNVAGGLAGGDTIEVTLALDRMARFTATTPAAERIYRSLGDETRIASSLDIGEGACCEWLPQETILFDGARLARRLDIALAPDAGLLAAEMLVLGRAAHGEVLRRGTVRDGWRVLRGGQLVWADALRLDSPSAALASRFALSGAGALATLLLAGPGIPACRDQARDLAGGGASLVAPDLLVARWVGEAGAVRDALAAAIAALRSTAFGHPARLPRLWRT